MSEVEHAMKAEERHNPFADDEETILGDMTRFAQPKPKPAPDAASIKAVAQERNYARPTSTKPERAAAPKRAAKPKAKGKTRDTYRTGRSEQFNIRCRAVDIERFDALCDAFGWVKGQGMEYAIDALEAILEDPKSPFWEARGIIPMKRK